MSTSELSPTGDQAQLWHAIRWIKSRLERLVNGDRPPLDNRSGCLFFWRDRRTTSDGEQPHPGRPARFERLRILFGLNGFEADLLLLCAAVELDPRTAELCAQAQGSEARPYPTLHLAFELFAGLSDAEPNWSVLSPRGPLLRWRLLEIRANASEPAASAPLKLDARILAFLLHLDGDRTPALPDPLGRLLRPVTSSRPVPATALSETQQRKAHELAELLRESARLNIIVHLLGSNTEAKYLILGRALAIVKERAWGRAFAYRLALEEWPVGAQDVPTFAQLWLREQRLDSHAVLVLDGHELDTDDRDRQAVFDELLARIDEGGAVVVAREPRPLENRRVRLLDVDKPTPLEQKAQWVDSLGSSWTERGISWVEAGRLVSRFNFNFPTINDLSERVSSDAESDSGQLDGLLDLCREITRPRVGALAERIHAKAKWDDLILPKTELKLLHQIAHQVRDLSTVYDDWGVRAAFGRGLGLGVLFAGESGTGKTFAAEVLAHELRLDLFRIDLSAVVDKFIGETEKNLRRLFDAAEEGGCILLFDEADALFGKRGEVKDSHDRFANIQINYLLQRIESFRGLAILTTNRKSALDIAFLRRLRFVVSFPFPSEVERSGIWAKTLPREGKSRVLQIPVDLSDADYVTLGRLALTGGNIRTVALNAAFLAAARDQSVTLELVKEAARTEFRKLGREAPPELRTPLALETVP